jgi:Putative Ig domain
MISGRPNSQLICSSRHVAIGITLVLLVLVAAIDNAFAAPKPRITSPTTDSGTVGLPYSYQITADQAITTWGATPLPAGLTVNTTTGLISGTPSVTGVFSITLSATNGNGTGTGPLTLTINPPPNGLFVGFRLPDFQTPPGLGYTPRLMLQTGATDPNGPHPFNATLEVLADATAGIWVPYNHFVGITDPTYAVKDGWIANAPLPIRDSTDATGTPQAFSNAQLTLSPPAVYMKADPRATRFGIFQMDIPLTTTKSRIMLPLWASGYPTVPNGFGGAVTTAWPGPVEHAPNRFASVAYYPATFCINSSTTDARDNATTTYLDNDNVLRPADAIYPGAAATTGSSTPYYYDPLNPTTSIVYRPIMLNRRFRNVAELGYAFRDLPWKTLDFFTDKSADAGLLDIFTINDGPPGVAIGGLGTPPTVEPTMTAGSLNLNSLYLDPNNSALAPVAQPVLAGAILDEINSTTVNNTGTGPTDAPVLAKNMANATSATSMQNKAELVTRAGLPTTILPTASNDNQAVKARREVVARTMSSVSQTRVWNLLIDVVAQSGHYKPNASSLQNDFIVEGEQHYWVHVAIDRFTGQVIDKQIEVVNE